MKIYMCDNKGTWREPLPIDESEEAASKCYSLLPDAPNDCYRVLVQYYNILNRYFRFVARRGESEGLIVEELSEEDARSLVLAYLQGEDVFRAAREKEVGITALIQRYTVRDGDPLFLLGADVPLQRSKNFADELSDRVRNYKMRREMGPRIILSDSRTAAEGEDPDLRLVPAKPATLTPVQIVVGAVIIGVVLGITFYCLFGRGNDETSQKKNEDTSHPVLTPEQSKETCKSLPEASAVPMQQPTSTEQGPSHE